jgi:membrane dipeptidase
MIARYEAEFAGRLLIGADDVQRWAAEPPGGICWGLLGVEGFDCLIRQRADLDRLASLFHRGVRVFQLVETGSSALGGAAAPGDDRGLTDLGRDFLAFLWDLAPPAGQPSPRPVIDLAHLNAPSTTDVLDWFEADASHRERLPLIRSHGGASLSPQVLTRLRAVGAIIGLSVGPPYVCSAAELRRGIDFAASIPFDGRAGFEGLGIGTDALNLTISLERLENVARIIAWLEESFDPAARNLIAHGNARKLLERVFGTGLDSTPA